MNINSVIPLEWYRRKLSIAIAKQGISSDITDKRCFNLSKTVIGLGQPETGVLFSLWKAKCDHARLSYLGHRGLRLPRSKVRSGQSGEVTILLMRYGELSARPKTKNRPNLGTQHTHRVRF